MPYNCKPVYCEHEFCDYCGEKGAYDFQGDLCCRKCLKEFINADQEFIKY
jgi:hypothetical protein